MRGEPVYAQKKPEKFGARKKQIKAAIDEGNKEDEAKVAAKKRDGHHCRWPHVAKEKAMCRRLRLDSAHYKGKGAGGSNERRNLISFCADVHEGPLSVHSGDRQPVPLTEDLMDGICAFEEKRHGVWVEVGREISVGVLK